MSVHWVLEGNPKGLKDASWSYACLFWHRCKSGIVPDEITSTDRSMRCIGRGNDLPERQTWQHSYGRLQQRPQQEVYIKELNKVLNTNSKLVSGYWLFFGLRAAYQTWNIRIAEWQKMYVKLKPASGRIPNAGVILSICLAQLIHHEW